MLEPIKALTKRMEGHPSEHTANGIADVYDALALILEQLEILKQHLQLRVLGRRPMSTTQSSNARQFTLLL
jgi:hypothetical protein